LIAEINTKRQMTTGMEPFDLYSPGIDADPFPAYKVLRDQYPCYWSESAKLWILSRYTDVFNAAQDWQTYSSSQGNLIDEIPGRAGGTLGTTDPPRHDRLRALAAAAFARKSIDQLIEPAIQIADQCIDKILKAGAFDFVDEFSSQITVGLLFKTMGLPPRDHADIRRKVILSVSTDKTIKGRSPEHIAAFKQLSDFITAEVAIRRANPKDDLITNLAEAEIDGDRLSEREIVLTSATFVVAGVESLSSFMSMFALNLHDHPDARRRLVANPELIEQAIEESLRFNTSAQRFKRIATREIELHGQTIRAGDTVVLAYGSANRDWRKFPNPDIYDVERRPQGHLGFGAGKHFCLGSQMARRVTEASMRRFLARLPDFHLTANDLKWNSSSNFRSPVALPFALKR
jgi:cytochrome P450